MEQMFERLAPKMAPPPPPPAQTQVLPPPPPAPAPAPFFTPQAPTTAATTETTAEPMDKVQPPPFVGKKPQQVQKSTAAPIQPSPQAQGTSKMGPPFSAPAAPITSQSPLQALETHDYGTDSSSSSYSSMPIVEETEPENLASPPKPEFGQLLDNIRQFLGIPNPTLQEEFRLGSGIGRDPNMLKLEQSKKPSSLKLPLQDELAKMLRMQDELLKPTTSSGLDIGQFPTPPPNRRN